MNIENSIDRLKKLEKKMHAYEHSMGLLSVDGYTVAPKGSAVGRGETLGILSEESHKLFANEEVGALLELLRSEISQIPDLQTKREIEELSEEYNKINNFPLEEYVEYAKLINEAGDVWHKAKPANDYASFEPYLARIVEFKKRIAFWYDKSRKPYDVLLDEYEKGANMEMLDKYFNSIKSEITPLVKQIAASGINQDKTFASKTFPVEKQRILSDYIMQVMGIDRNYCNIQETEHPFTDKFNKYDVRITTHYYENDLLSSFFSVVHEGGHAIYEMSTDDKLLYTCLASGASYGMHESQSRFFENIIGRSKEFISFMLPELKRLFPEQLNTLDADSLYFAANRSEPSLIRIEADELTYSLHIMVRYEIEKLLINGDINTKEAPKVWNKLYKEYLGVNVPDDAHGILQDSHWSGGSIGYFPSYSLGSAYGAQILNSIKKGMDFYALVGKGELSPIKAWLTDKIYKYGKMLTPQELLMNCCGENFDESYYINYMKNKFEALYKL